MNMVGSFHAGCGMETNVTGFHFISLCTSSCVLHIGQPFLFRDVLIRHGMPLIFSYSDNNSCIHGSFSRNTTWGLAVLSL